MPLYMRLPKLRGFKSRKYKPETVYTGQLNEVKKQTIDVLSLFEVGVISSPYVKVKLITKGELKSKKDVKLPAASQSAVEMLKKAGGSFTKVEQQRRPATEKAKKTR